MEFTETLQKQMKEAKRELEELPPWMKRVLSQQKSQEAESTGDKVAGEADET
jgi:hypothetical protein